HQLPFHLGEGGALVQQGAVGRHGAQHRRARHPALRLRPAAEHERVGRDLEQGEGGLMAAEVTWEAKDYSRIPYRGYHDPEIYEVEHERIFRGKVWSFLCLEAEIPKPGDFRTTWLGEIPILVSRGQKGEIFAVENRCAHRGALVRREFSGND